MAPIHPEAFDWILMALAQQHDGGVQDLLNTFFSFLARKTDFYTGASTVATQKIIFRTLQKYGSVAGVIETEKKKDSEEAKPELKAKEGAEPEQASRKRQSSTDNIIRSLSVHAGTAEVASKKKKTDDDEEYEKVDGKMHSKEQKRIGKNGNDKNSTKNLKPLPNPLKSADEHHILDPLDLQLKNITDYEVKNKDVPLGNEIEVIETDPPKKVHDPMNRILYRQYRKTKEFRDKQKAKKRLKKLEKDAQ